MGRQVITRFSEIGASYVLVLPKRWPTHASGIRGDFSHPAFSGIRKLEDD
jgi:hypothetical protein